MNALHDCRYGVVHTYIYFCGGALAMPIASFRTKLQLPLEQPIHTGLQMELKNAYFQAIRSPLIDAQSKSQRRLKKLVFATSTYLLTFETSTPSGQWGYYFKLKDLIAPFCKKQQQALT